MSDKLKSRIADIESGLRGAEGALRDVLAVCYGEKAVGPGGGADLIYDARSFVNQIRKSVRALKRDLYTFEPGGTM